MFGMTDHTLSVFPIFNEEDKAFILNLIDKMDGDVDSIKDKTIAEIIKLYLKHERD